MVTIMAARRDAPAKVYCRIADIVGYRKECGQSHDIEEDK
jgi:hypothetical protein